VLYLSKDQAQQFGLLKYNMELTKDSFKQKGIFSGAPVEKLVTWKTAGEEYTFTVFVKQLAYHAAVSDVMSHVKGGDALAGRIAASICDREGNAIFTADDITGEADPVRGALDGNLTLALLTAISEVNGLGEAKN
jgi:hypothetical protein